MRKLAFLIVFFLFSNFCLCQTKTFTFKKAKIFFDNKVLENSSNTIKYLSLTNNIVKNLSDEFDFDITEKKDMADIDIYLRSSTENSSLGGTRIFFYFKRRFEDKPIEGFLYKVPIGNILNEDTLAEYKTLFKPFRICLSLILANLYPKNYINNSNSKYLVYIEFDNKSNIDTLLGQKLSQIVKRIFLFHQKEFDYQCIEELEKSNKKTISIGIHADFAELENKGQIILSFKTEDKDIILNNSTVSFDKTMIANDDIFKIMSLLNREIKTSLLQYNKKI